MSCYKLLDQTVAAFDVNRIGLPIDHWNEANPFCGNDALKLHAICFACPTTRLVELSNNR